MNSKQKGSRGERALRDQFREAGFTARRTQQYCGTDGTSDVRVEELPWLHVECKNTEKKNFLEWLDQAQRDKDVLQTPLVCHKRNLRKEWIAILPLTYLLNIIRRSDLVLPKKEKEEKNGPL